MRLPRYVLASDIGQTLLCKAQILSSTILSVDVWDISVACLLFDIGHHRCGHARVTYGLSICPAPPNDNGSVNMKSVEKVFIPKSAFIEIIFFNASIHQYLIECEN